MDCFGGWGSLNAEVCIIIVTIIIIIIISSSFWKNFGTVSAWKKKKGKTSKLVDAGSNDWNEN